MGTFEDGYEIKWVSMRNIVLDDLGPTVEELTRYNKVMYLELGVSNSPSLISVLLMTRLYAVL